MECETGDIYFFEKYQHSKTDKIKNRTALILVSNEVADFINGSCAKCSQSCSIYASPIEKRGIHKSCFPLLKNNYNFLDCDRYCNIIESNLQKTCNQKHHKRGKIKKEDISSFIEHLRLAYRTDRMDRNLSDPYFRGFVIQQWVELSP